METIKKYTGYNVVEETETGKFQFSMSADVDNREKKAESEIRFGFIKEEDKSKIIKLFDNDFYLVKETLTIGKGFIDYEPFKKFHDFDRYVTMELRFNNEVIDAVATIMENEEVLNRKYNFIPNKHTICDGKVVCRIVATRDFGDIKAGDIGGYLGDISNLGLTDNSWVYNDVCVCDDAKISENGKVKGRIRLIGKINIFDNAIVEGWSCEDSIIISGNKPLNIFGNAKIIIPKEREWEHFGIHGAMDISGDVHIEGRIMIFPNQVGTKIDGNKIIKGDGMLLKNWDILHSQFGNKTIIKSIVIE